MVKLDSLDRRILFEMDKNSRLPFSVLAQRLRQGRDRVEYRYDRLAEERVIRKCIASVDVYKLGLILFKTYVRLEYKKPRVSEFLNFLREHPRIYWVAQCDGGWDVIFAIFAESADDFYRIHSEILSVYNEIILNFAAYTLVEFKSLSRGHLYRAPWSQHRLGGMPIKNPIDQIDFQILKLLARDARLAVVDIAERVNATSAIVKYRIERLEKLGIITGYHLDLDLAKLKLQMFKSQLFIRNYDLKLREQFEEYCLSHPNIIFFIEQVGDCNIELELEVETYQDYAAIMEEVRIEYAKLIRNFNTVYLRNTWISPVPNEIPGLIAESPENL